MKGSRFLFIGILICVFYTGIALTQSPQKNKKPETMPTTQKYKPKFNKKKPRIIRPKIKSMLEGVWKLSKAFYPGAPPDLHTAGYLVITKSYASFHLLIREKRLDPVFQSGFWRYTILGNRILFQTILDLKSDPGGKIHLEGGKTIYRTFQLGPSFLKLYRRGGGYLSFVKIE